MIVSLNNHSKPLRDNLQKLYYFFGVHLPTVGLGVVVAQVISSLWAFASRADLE
jgi:hypothetical protein